MKNVMKRVALVLSFAVFSQPAWSLIEGGAGYSLLSVELDDSSTTEKYSGTGMQLFGMIDPIPLVPVGFGVLVETGTLDVETVGVSDITFLKTALTVSAWSPVSFFSFTPKATLGYHVFSKTTFPVTSEVDYLYKMNGYFLQAGVDYSLIPLVSVGLAYRIENTTWEADSVEGIANVSVDLSGLPKYDVKGGDIILQVAVGI